MCTLAFVSNVFLKKHLLVNDSCAMRECTLRLNFAQDAFFWPINPSRPTGISERNAEKEMRGVGAKRRLSAQIKNLCLLTFGGTLLVPKLKN